MEGRKNKERQVVLEKGTQCLLCGVEKVNCHSLEEFFVGGVGSNRHHTYLCGSFLDRRVGLEMKLAYVDAE